jgi:hypothetical protein
MPSKSRRLKMKEHGARVAGHVYDYLVEDILTTGALDAPGNQQKVVILAGTRLYSPIRDFDKQHHYWIKQSRRNQNRGLIDDFGTECWTLAEEVAKMLRNGAGSDDARTYLNTKQQTDAISLPRDRDELAMVIAKYYDWGGNECDFFDEAIPGGFLLSCWVGRREKGYID